MGSTEFKLGRLKALFAYASQETLLDILVSCDGSLKEAIHLINTSEKLQPSSKRSRCNSQRILTHYLPGLPKLNGKPSNKPITLNSKEEIESTLKYCTYHEYVLPEEVANALLVYIMNDKEAKSNEFYLFGNKCISNHRVRRYSCMEDGRSSYYNGKLVTNNGNYTDEMMISQVIIEDLVNKELLRRPRLKFQVKPGDWKCNFVLGNIYDITNNLQWHSDKMTDIGPHSIVASISLGFSREFRIRKIYPSNSQVYSIRLKHNSMLIMHAGFQEEYKHCVPLSSKNANISKDDVHPISGTVRVNLTYRNCLMKEAPRCVKCNYPMVLRRSFKSPRKRGNYIWICSKSYTEFNEFKIGNSCKGFRYANFDKESQITDDEEHTSVWIADDDQEAFSYRLIK